jgi:CRP/FNR family transcriptional regulator, cyclic AMP receptor protein
VARLEDIAAIPLFASLSQSELQELAPWFQEQTTSEGVRLCGEGAAGYSFFVITEGKAVVTADGARLRDLGPGDFFGEIAMLDGGRRSATVTTTSPAKLLVMFGTDFRRLQDAQPDVAARLEEAMQQRLATDD